MASRALHATLLAAVIAVGGVSAGAVANEAPATTYGVAEPRPGDRVEYEVEAVRVGPGIPGFHVDVERFVAEWLSPTQVLVDGERVETRPLRLGASIAAAGTGIQRDFDTVATFFFDAAGNIVAADFDGRVDGGGDLVLDLGPDPLRSGISPEGRVEVRHFGLPWSPCGMLTPLHGHQVPAGEGVQLGPCSQTSGAPFQLAGVETHADRQVVRLDHTGDGEVSVWYNPAFSLPLRMRIALVEFLPSEWRAGLVFELHAVHHAVGTQEYALQAPTPAAVPGPVLAARTPLGPSVASVDQPAPIADAVAAAMDDETAPRVQDFVDRRDAYLAVAFPHQYRDEYGRVAADWFLLWTDGERQIAKFVRQDPRPQVLGMLRQYSVEEAPGNAFPEDVTGLLPPRDRLPGSLPTVASVLAMQRAYGTREEAPLYWGFSYACTGSTCTDVEARVVAGVQQRPREVTPNVAAGGAPVSAAWIESTLAVDAQGHVVSAHHYAPEPTLPFVRPGDAAPQGDVPESGGASAVWQPAAVSATAGLGALLGGLLYYFWPQLKALVPGFSRIRPDRVLDHPQRAAVMELIREHPGIHFQDLHRRTGMGNGTLEHHLQTLARNRHVVVRGGGGYTCYFARGAMDHATMAAAPLLKSAAARRVLAAIAAGRGSSLASLSAAARIGRSTAGHHVKRMREAGLVRSGPDGHAVSSLGQQALAAFA